MGVFSFPGMIGIHGDREPRAYETRGHAPSLLHGQEAHFEPVMHRKKLHRTISSTTSQNQGKRL